MRSIIDRHTAWLEKPKENRTGEKRPYAALIEEDDAPAPEKRNRPFAQASKQPASASQPSVLQPPHNGPFNLTAYVSRASQLFAAVTSHSLLLERMYSMTIKDREEEELFGKKLRKIRTEECWTLEGQVRMFNRLGEGKSLGYLSALDDNEEWQRAWLKTECLKIFGEKWKMYLDAREEELGDESDDELQVLCEDKGEEDHFDDDDVDSENIPPPSHRNLRRPAAKKPPAPKKSSAVHKLGFDWFPVANYQPQDPRYNGKHQCPVIGCTKNEQPFTRLFNLKQHWERVRLSDISWMVEAGRWYADCSLCSFIRSRCRLESIGIMRMGL